MDWMLVAAGFVVAITGVGGGALMTRCRDPLNAPGGHRVRRLSGG